MRTLLYLIGAMLALTACEVKRDAEGAAQTATASGPITQAEAEKIVTDTEAAWGGGSIEAVMANYAAGAVVFDSSTLAPTTDRNAQTKANAGFLTMKPADFRVDPRHIQLLDNDTIVSSGVIAFTVAVGLTREMMRVRYSHVYQRQADGSFKIVHEHMSAPPPGSPLP